ncbi:MAG TPA: transglycosylase SLT domain-containing protein [Burkholderiales bacterium]|nr:transglycosylase SLT domain-containing protein [Burkholderiales bacterium]
MFAAALAGGAAASAASPDDAVLAAYDAYRAGNALQFARYAKSLEQHPLAPWIAYWGTALRLEDADASDVRAVLSKYQGTYVAERLRGDWLKVLGRRGDWQQFEREAALYARDDLEVRCYSALARLARGDEAAAAELAAAWLEPKELPPGCEALAQELADRGRVSATEVWQRVRLLFENGQITAAKTALGYLPRGEAPDERSLADAARQPKRLLERLPKNLEIRAAREVVVLAGARYARTDPEAMAAELQGRLGARLPESDSKYLWGRVAYEGARQLNEQALKWYARAGNAGLTDEQLAWKARAALRRGDWRLVRDAIDRMSAQAAQAPAWIYWYGRSLAAQGEEAGARAYFLRIAGQPDFYGLLANEELGYVGTLPANSYVPTEDAVAEAAREPGLARALALIKLGIRTEGVREWLFTIRGYSDSRLLAAAELARRAEVYDRTINTAERTEQLHNFDLRYPVPFSDVFSEYAKTQGLDEAWVLGLVRQESRFIAEARSGAGAAGLMQLMPRTARYVAKKIGLRNFAPRHVTDVHTNVTLGTGYLRMVLDQVGSPVLASAAYNAGPGRARRWRDARPLEGAVYVETIPFNETRDYVKKVMANSVFYAALLEKRLSPLKARLGVIAARDGGESVDEELP